MKRDSIISLIASVLLALVVWHQGSTSLFLHTHDVDGNVVVHSHPFSDRTGGHNHTHNALQLLTISLLSAIAALLGVSAIISGGLFTGHARHKAYSQRFVPHCVLLTPTLRGPPVS